MRERKEARYQTFDFDLFLSEQRRRHRLPPAVQREPGRPHPGDAGDPGEARRAGRLHQHQVHDPHLRVLPHQENLRK